MADFDRSRRGDAALLTALVAGATQEAAARQARVSERTVRRRLDDPAFRAALTAARDELVAQATAQLTAAAAEAVATLRDLLGSDTDSARLAAARAILEIGGKFREQHDLLARLAVVEDQLKEPQRWRPRTA